MRNRSIYDQHKHTLADAFNTLHHQSWKLGEFDNELLNNGALHGIARTIFSIMFIEEAHNRGMKSVCTGLSHDVGNALASAFHVGRKQEPDHYIKLAVKFFHESIKPWTDMNDNLSCDAFDYIEQYNASFNGTEYYVECAREFLTLQGNG